MIEYIIIYIYMQKLTSTDRYSLSYDSAKFDTAMANFDAILRQAITSSISDCFPQRQICLPARIYVDDALLAAVGRKQMEQRLAAIIEAIFTVLGEPEVKY